MREVQSSLFDQLSAGQEVTNAPLDDNKLIQRYKKNLQTDTLLLEIRSLKLTRWSLGRTRGEKVTRGSEYCGYKSVKHGGIGQNDGE